MFKFQIFKLSDKDFLKKSLLEYKKPIVTIIVLDLFASLFMFMLPFVFKFFIDSVIIGKEYSLFYPIVSIIICGAIFSLIVQYISSFYRTNLSGKLLYQRTKLYLPKAVYANKIYNVGEITNTLTDMLRNSNAMVTTYVPSLIKNIITILIMLIILLIMDWKLTACVFLPAFAILSYLAFTSKRIKRISKDQIDIYSDVYSIIKSIFTNIIFVNVFSLENFFLGKYEYILDDYSKKQTKLAHLIAKQFVVSLMFFILPTLILLFYGGQLIMSGEITLGILTMFISYLVTISEILNYSVSLLVLIQQTIPAINKLSEIYYETPKEWGDKEMKYTNGDIEVKNLHFEYDRVIFDDLSCSFKKGINILVGRNGSGKSTLLNIFTRVIDIDDGEIFYDGMDINEITESSLKENVGFVMAKPFIFESDMRTNLRLNDDINDDELLEVIEKVKLNNLLDKLPEGLDTVLTEDVINLSSGEQQKIALARVLLKNPNVILLDEVGSNIDSESLDSIYECLFSLAEEKTIIIVDHHLQYVNDQWNIVDITPQ